MNGTTRQESYNFLPVRWATPDRTYVVDWDGRRYVAKRIRREPLKKQRRDVRIVEEVSAKYETLAAAIGWCIRDKESRDG